jgi:short-subunit dehydrogenase
VADAARETLRRFGDGLGALVNNAGFGQPGAVEDLSRETMRAQFEVNVFGLQDLTKRLLPTMRHQGWGRIVNISSVVGRVALPFMGIYSASKFAVEALSDAMRVELHDSGVAVSVVEPGPIETSFGANAVTSGKANLDPERSVFGAAYRQRLDRVATRNKHKEAFRLPPDAVARAVQHALESSHPRRRYAVTIPAHLGAFLARFAPDAVVDRLLLAYVRSNAKEEKPEAGVPS